MEQTNNLYYTNMKGEIIDSIAFDITEEEASRIMHQYIQDCLKFNSYYVRCWYDEKHNKYMDYGSWSHYFVWGQL